MIPPDASGRESGRLHAMLALLDDPDPTVRDEVERALQKQGIGVAAALREVAGGSNRPAAAHATSVLGQIALDAFISTLAPMLDRHDDLLLEDGALALCRLHTPDLDEAPVRVTLDRLAERLSTHLDRAENGFGLMRECNRYLLDVEGFGPCGQKREEYYDPENSYLHRILERRISIPVGLGLIYLLVGRRLGLAIGGVNFPAHFLLLYNDGTRSFYIDPFNDGQFLAERECRATLRGLGMEERAEYMGATSGRRILARMMRNLEAIYRERWPRATEVLGWAVGRLDDE